MQYEFAPMEGITGYRFRNLHHRYFSGVSRYFMPFYSPAREHVLPRKALTDFLPEHNRGIPLVPQLLTKYAEDFLWAAGELAAMGYTEVNLNLGCPSGTVTAKGKGAGFLAFPAELERFLDEVFSACPLPVSIKTRLGMTSPEEFSALLALYNRYPACELIVHPRVRSDFYQGAVRMEGFEAAVAGSRNPLCYNGDLTTTAHLTDLAARFPTVERAMLGRGLLANPALARQANGGAPATREELRAFHDELYESYSADFGSRRNASLRMKELWSYLIARFQDSDKLFKRLRKSEGAAEFESAAAAIFHQLPLAE